MRTRAQLIRRRLRQRGSILLDSLIGLMILSMAAVSFFTLFPTVHKSHAISEQEQKATQLGTKMLEHLQLLSPSKLNATTLTSMQLIDTGQTDAPFTFDDVPLDSATGFSPNRALKNGTGVLDIVDIGDGSTRVVLTISWESPSGSQSNVTMGTILGAHRS